MNNPIKHKVFITATACAALIFFCAFLIFFNFNRHKIARAGTGDTTTGYAWSKNIGWISFNCVDTGSCAVNYGVNIDPAAGNFSGYAWSENIGWISFQETGDTAAEIPPDNYTFNANCLNVCDDTNDCTACYNSTDNNVYGWAKILSLGDDGWVNLNCLNDSSCAIINYGVNINPVTSEFTGWAWNSNINGLGIGWISFNCVDTGCGIDYKIHANFSVPDAPTNLQVAEINCTTVQLTWDHVSSGETGFDSIYSDSADGSTGTLTTPLCSPGPGVHQCTTLMPEGTLRYFWARALGAVGNSDWSPSGNGVPITTSWCPPNLTYDSAGASCDSIDLSWIYGDNSNVDEYRIYKDSGGGFLKIATTTPNTPGNTTTYTDTDIISDITYSYYVIASSTLPDATSNTLLGVKPCPSLPTWREVKP